MAVVQEGILGPVEWREIEAIGRAMAEFLKVNVTPDRVLTARTEAGEITLAWAEGRARIRLTAQGDGAIQNLRDTLGYMCDGQRDGMSAGLVWSGQSDLEGSLPPNFREARVGRVERVSPRFIRMRLHADDLGFMNRTGLHLRLLQPKDRRNPSWPRLSAAGRTVWPGSEALHMPVYTVRAIDPKAGWLDVEVYLHGRGPTCAWAQAAREGDPVGLTGPGGGWLLSGRQLCLGGDETAVPVIARMLEEAADDTTGDALIEVADAEDIRPLRAPPGVRVTWLPRSTGMDGAFTELARQCLARNPECEILFGGEKTCAQTIRNALRAVPDAAARPKPSIAAYWANA